MNQIGSHIDCYWLQKWFVFLTTVQHNSCDSDRYWMTNTHLALITVTLHPSCANHSQYVTLHSHCTNHSQYVTQNSHCTNHSQYVTQNSPCANHSQCVTQNSPCANHSQYITLHSPCTNHSQYVTRLEAQISTLFTLKVDDCLKLTHLYRFTKIIIDGRDMWFTSIFSYIVCLIIQIFLDSLD